MHEVMSEYGRVTHSRLLAYLPNREPRKHLYELAADYPLRGGHGLRPSICIANAKAFGASEALAVLSAVSIELLHNALLVHDDIEDGSLLRRGQPTLHELHGIPIALNVGDTMLLMSQQPLIDNLKMLTPSASRLIIQDRHQTAWETAEGQAMELGWRRDNTFNITEQDYLVMVTKKTSWLTMIHPLRVGAIIGTSGRVDLKSFFRLGYFLGAAFQIRDDLLNLIGELESYGKEIDGDIMEGKRTLMLLHVFNSVSERERKELTELMSLSREQRTGQTCWISDLMQRHGSIEYADQVARSLARAAHDEFIAIYRSTKNTRDRRFIEGLCQWVVERK
jgi:geranylgeranyl diphosphate synthase type II